jgi:Flp pilus assembly protein TadB
MNFTSDFYLFVSVFTLLRSVNGSTCLSWSILLYMMMKNSLLHTYLFLFICLGTGIFWIITRSRRKRNSERDERNIHGTTSEYSIIVLSTFFC